MRGGEATDYCLGKESCAYLELPIRWGAWRYYGPIGHACTSHILFSKHVVLLLPMKTTSYFYLHRSSSSHHVTVREL